MKQSAGILDNKSLGNVVSELKGNIAAGCTLSVVSALFSLYAYDELKKELSKIDKFRLLVPSLNDEESFLRNLTGNHLDRRLRNQLDVTRIARECSEWLKQKCEVRELPSSVHQNLIHLSHAGSNEHLAIVGSSSFTTDGLGIVPSESHHMNTCFRSSDEAHSLIKWFDDLWASGKDSRVLVLCPKKLRENWTLYTVNDKRNIMASDRFKFDVLNHSDLTRLRGMSGEINLETLNFDYFKLLDLLTIARSRKHIEKYYDMTEIGKFPERLRPFNIKADIDTEGRFPALKSINRDIRMLNLSAYAPLKYVLPHKAEEYSRKYDRKVAGGSVFRQVDREQSLIHLMRVNLFKRMESSINSFSMTLEKLLGEVNGLIQHKVTNPINPGNKKIIIFTAFADTAKYLYEHTAKWAHRELGIYAALVTGSGENKTEMPGIRKDLAAIITSFSPISKEREKIDSALTAEIDLLIATDCISEGQNLQDCDFLINYDIHWNPVRIIMNDLEYRRKQLEKLQNEVVDIDDVEGGLSITDLTLNDFRMDLGDYIKEHENLLERIAAGAFAVATIDDSLKGELSPGVIFCLKNEGAQTVSDTTYALSPYYLVYVSNDGSVILQFTQTKKILDLLKKMSIHGKSIDGGATTRLSSLTRNGSDMSHYRSLLSKAVQALTGAAEERGVESLFSPGGTVINKNSFKGMDDFEVVSYLILLDHEELTTKGTKSTKSTKRNLIRRLHRWPQIIFVSNLRHLKGDKAMKVTIQAKGTEIAVISRNNEDDYISLTDIAKYKNRDDAFIVINNWMRLRDTIEFLGLWESFSNPDFKPIEFDRFRQES